MDFNLPESVPRAATLDIARRIRVGVGGWTYEPWRSNFYPPGLPQHQELEIGRAHV